MVMLDGAVIQVPSDKVDEMVKYANWVILSKMNIRELRRLPAVRKIEGYDQKTKKEILEQL